MVSLRSFARALLASALTASAASASTPSFLQLHRVDNDQSSGVDASEDDVLKFIKDNKLNDVAQDGTPEDLIEDPEELIHALTDQARTRAMGFREFADDVVKDISPQDSNVADNDVAERVRAAEEDMKDFALAKTEDEDSEKLPVDPPSQSEPQPVNFNLASAAKVKKMSHPMTPRMERTKEQFQEFANQITGQPAPLESEAAQVAPVAAPEAPWVSDTATESEPQPAGTPLASQNQQASEEIKDYTQSLASNTDHQVASSSAMDTVNVEAVTDDSINQATGGSSVQDEGSSVQAVSSASVDEERHEEAEDGSVVEEDDAVSDVTDEGTSGEE